MGTPRAWQGTPGQESPVGATGRGAVPGDTALAPALPRGSVTVSPNLPCSWGDPARGVTLFAG